MNFTREPIIETVITPRDGCKLIVRSSKGNSQEEYQVDAVEVVSFGHSFFFRSIEKPRPFLVPVGDYEIIELREARMALKTAAPERSIKIGGGREASLRPQREAQSDERSSDEGASSHGDSDRSDRKRDRRRRGRRGRDRMSPVGDTPSPQDEAQEEVAPETPSTEEPKAPSFMSKLFPPPPTLIKESLGRYKHLETSAQEEVAQERDEGVFLEPTDTNDEDSDEPRRFED